jgi:hypothetical protein
LLIELLPYPIGIKGPMAYVVLPQVESQDRMDATDNGFSYSSEVVMIIPSLSLKNLQKINLIDELKLIKESGSEPLTKSQIYIRVTLDASQEAEGYGVSKSTYGIHPRLTICGKAS